MFWFNSHFRFNFNFHSLESLMGPICQWNRQLEDGYMWGEEIYSRILTILNLFSLAFHSGVNWISDNGNVEEKLKVLINLRVLICFRRLNSLIRIGGKVDKVMKEVL